MKRVQVSQVSLLPHQLEGAAWLMRCRGGLLGDDNGLGKTATVLTALPANGRSIIVCRTVFEEFWKGEIQDWTSLEVIGADASRWPSAGEVLVMSSGKTLRRSLGELPQNITLVCDEAHLLLNTKTKRTIMTRSLARAIRRSGGRVWLLTSSPPISLDDARKMWTLLDVAGATKEFGKEFGNRFLGTFFSAYDCRFKGHTNPLQSVLLRRTMTDI